MGKMFGNPFKTEKRDFYTGFIELILVGGITGIATGAIVTIFNVLMHEGEAISKGIYAYVRANPAFIPLLLLALLAGGLLIGVLVNISLVIRGCGVPQAEGASRGTIKFKWWRDLICMFTSTLLSVFMGLSIGSEGPSVLIGALTGDGVASALKRNRLTRKYQITGGASTGLAVAANAPLTGIIFAFEEAHKHFTPEVFICAFSSVIFGVITRSALYEAMGLTVTSSFHSYVFHEMPFGYYPYMLLASIVCGVLGVYFCKLSSVSRRLFKKIGYKDKRVTYTIRILVAVLIGGCCSLLAVEAMGGGHDLIESLGTFGGVSDTFFTKGIVWTLLIALLLKYFVTAVNVGSGIPCGIFIPIIAIGACIGGLLNWLWVVIDPNMQPYLDLMTMICMASFFTTIVQAPLTAIVMICEFTGSFAPLLPVVIGVSIGYVISEITRTEGIYEVLLEEYEEEHGKGESLAWESYTVRIEKGSLAYQRTVREVLWPGNAWITEIIRGEEHILPDGDILLKEGDVLTVLCKTDDPQGVQEELEHIVS